MRKELSIAVLAAGLAFSGAALADKPSWAGGGKHGKQADDDRPRESRDAATSNVNISVHFGSRERQIVQEYYQTQARAGHCPPGLAKKNNGCLPPGQAKKWARGRPLPPDLGYHELPRDLLVRLPAPPAGHRYVQVAGDVLMVAVGSSMVVDAIEDLMR